MNKEGFTLLELIIVLTIMVAITAIAWPFLTKKMNASKSKIFEQKVEEAVENTRYEAIIKGKSFLIQIDGENINITEINKTDLNRVSTEKVLISADGKLSRFK